MARLPPVVQVRRLAHHEGLPLPAKQTAGAAGYDVASAEPDFTLEPHGRRLVRTGLQLAIPAGYEAQVRPRSGLAVKHGLTLPNGWDHQAPRRSGRDRRDEESKVIWRYVIIGFLDPVALSM